MADPVLQIFQQEQGGSANGSGFGADFAQGRNFNLMQQRINLEKAEEQRKAAMFPLEKKMAERKDVVDALKTGIFDTRADLNVQRAAATVALQKLKLDFQTSPKGFGDDALIRQYIQLTDQHPELTLVPDTPGNEIMRGIQGMVMKNKMFTDLMTLDAKAKEQGEFVRSFQDKTSGIDIQMGERTGDLQAERLRQAQIRLNQQAQDALLRGDSYLLRLVKLQQDAKLNGIEIKGLQEAIDERHANAQVPYPNVGNSTQPPVQSDGVVPDSVSAPNPAVDALNPSVVSPTASPVASPRAAPAQIPITITPTQRPTTPATTTQLQKENTNIDVALRQLNEAHDVIRNNPDAFGPIGKGRELIETAQGIIDQNNPDASTRIFDARQKAGMAFSAIAKSLRTDSGNMSRYELNKLEGIGDPNSLRISPQDALRMESNIRNTLMAKKLRILKGLNASPDDAFLSTIPSSEITGLLTSGLISKEDALRWHRLKQ